MKNLLNTAWLVVHIEESTTLSDCEVAVNHWICIAILQLCMYLVV